MPLSTTFYLNTIESGCFTVKSVLRPYFGGIRICAYATNSSLFCLTNRFYFPILNVKIFTDDPDGSVYLLPLLAQPPRPRRERGLRRDVDILGR